MKVGSTWKTSGVAEGVAVGGTGDGVGGTDDGGAVAVGSAVSVGAGVGLPVGTGEGRVVAVDVGVLVARASNVTSGLAVRSNSGGLQAPITTAMTNRSAIQIFVISYPPNPIVHSSPGTLSELGTIVCSRFVQNACKRATKEVLLA